MSLLTTNHKPDSLCRILSLDGGGAKGFYTLGVLKEIEAMIGCPLHKRFDLVFGTSTGAIIATLIALGYEVDQIHKLYKEHVPTIMSRKTRKGRTKALKNLVAVVFADHTFADIKTGIGVIAAKWITERPMIFKGSIQQAHGSKGTFVPGFGVSIADAVQASCSAFPFFEKKIVTTSADDKIELIDGGYCANNPTLYAIADAVIALKKDHCDLRVVNVGVGVYPEPKKLLMWLVKKIPFNSIQLLQKTLEINTQSMDQLRTILFKDVPTIRINDTFERPEMATDLMEHDLDKLNILRQRVNVQSFPIWFESERGGVIPTWFESEAAGLGRSSRNDHPYEPQPSRHARSGSSFSLGYLRVHVYTRRSGRRALCRHHTRVAAVWVSPL